MSSQARQHADKWLLDPWKSKKGTPYPCGAVFHFIHFHPFPWLYYNGIRGCLKMFGKRQKWFHLWLYKDFERRTDSTQTAELQILCHCRCHRKQIARKIPICACSDTARLYRLFSLFQIFEIVWSSGFLCKALKGKTNLGPIAIGCTLLTYHILSLFVAVFVPSVNFQLLALQRKSVQLNHSLMNCLQQSSPSTFHVALNVLAVRP